MKRDPALQPLSRDHHQALFAAQRLRRADEDSARDAQRAFLEFWRSHGKHHFRCEEEILLPVYAAHGDARHPLVVRVLADHVDIRREAVRIEQGSEETLVALQELGVMLADHVRLEERELFPLIEETLPASELEALAAALAEAEEAGPR